MSLLSEFLLERIGEDEDEGNFFPPKLVMQRLAECQARRRIVEECTVTPGDGAYGDGWGTLADQVLFLLAAPYADHLDYKPEWKPIP